MLFVFFYIYIINILTSKSKQKLHQKKWSQNILLIYILQIIHFFDSRKFDSRIFIFSYTRYIQSIRRQSIANQTKRFIIWSYICYWYFVYSIWSYIYVSVGHWFWKQFVTTSISCWCIINQFFALIIITSFCIFQILITWFKMYIALYIFIFFLWFAYTCLSPNIRFIIIYIYICAFTWL